MKRITLISMFAVAAMATFSCTKEIEVNSELEKIDGKVFVLNARVDDDIKIDTKTALNGVNVVWSEGDQIAALNKSDVRVVSEALTSENIKEGGKWAQFTFADGNIENNMYLLAYPAANATACNSSTFVWDINIPSSQTTVAGGFANGANLALAEGTVADEDVRFKNVGGLISVIINNDNIESVTISANEIMTGAGTAKLDENTVNCTKTGNKYVTLTGGLTNGSEYYAVVYPGEYTGLKIEITRTNGDVATYTNSNALTVNRNDNKHIATLTIPDGKWVTPTKGTEYIWEMASGDFGTTETPATNITKGTPNLTWNASYTWSGNNYLSWDNSRGVQVGSSKNPITNLTLSTSKYTEYVSAIKVNFSRASIAGPKVLSVTVGGTSLLCGENSTVDATTTATDYLFESASLLKGDIVITFTNDAGTALYIKGVAINPDTRTPQTLSFPQAAYSVELTEGTFANPGLTGANTTVTYTSSDTEVATVDVNTGEVTLKTVGTTRITASAVADATYKDGETSYELTVNAGPISIASVIEAANNDSVYTSGIVAQVNAKGLIITDGTNNLLVYLKSEPTVKVGDKVKVSGTRGSYNNVPQISSPVITTVSSENTVTRTAITEITESNCTGYTTSSYVSLKGVLSISGSYYNISIDESTVVGSLYQYKGSDISSYHGRSVVVIGYVAGSTTKYLYIAQTSITIDESVDYLDVSPTTLSWSGAEITPKTITVDWNKDSGYSVDDSAVSSWLTVSDDRNGTITCTPKNASVTNSDADIVISHNGGSLSQNVTCSQSGAAAVTYTITWGSTTNSSSISSYVNEWSVTVDGFTCNMVNWNNYNNGWNYVKAGRKNYASVATITTNTTIPEAIKTVKLTIDACTSNKINSIKLYTSTSSDFSTKMEYSFTVGNGEQTVTLAPATDLYYQVEVDAASGSSNGLIQVSKLVFTTE